MLDFVYVAMRAGDRTRLFVHSLQSTAHPIVANGSWVNRKVERVLIRNTSLLRISTFCR